jgi:hypothetical protein
MARTFREPPSLSKMQFIRNGTSTTGGSRASPVTGFRITSRMCGVYLYQVRCIFTLSATDTGRWRICQLYALLGVGHQQESFRAADAGLGAHVHRPKVCRAVVAKSTFPGVCESRRRSNSAVIECKYRPVVRSSRLLQITDMRAYRNSQTSAPKKKRAMHYVRAYRKKISKISALLHLLNRATI